MKRCKVANGLLRVMPFFPFLFSPLPFFSAPQFAAELPRSGWWPRVTSVSGTPGGEASVSSLLAEGPCRNRARQAAVPRNGRNRRKGLELVLPLITEPEGTGSEHEEAQETASVCIRPTGALP